MVSKSVILGIGAIALLAIFGIYFAANAEDLLDVLEIVRNFVRIKKIDITSPEQLEQLTLCLKQRATGCDSVNGEDYWTELKGTPFEGCPCGGEWMAGTDVYVHFKFRDHEAYTLPVLTEDQTYAGFDKIENYNQKCNVCVSDDWWGTTLAKLVAQTQRFLLFYDPNEEHYPFTIYNGTQGIIVVNTRRTVGKVLADELGIDSKLQIVQGCFVINKE